MDDRSERLRRRRKRSSAGVNQNGAPAGEEESAESAETSESDEPSEASKPSKPQADTAGAADPDGEEGDGDRDESAATADPDEGDDGDDGDDEERPTSVKDQQVGTYMYLPESQVKRLNRQYNVLKAEYEFEYSEEFEKNRHFYPLVVQYGLERLDELDVEQVRAHLRAIYE